MRYLKLLYVQVLIGIALGVTIGHFSPEAGVSLKPVGDAFIALMKMLIGPIIFTTVVIGMAGMGDLRKAGKVGLKAFVYFEAATTLALVIGLVVANLVRPGEGLHVDVASLDAKSVSGYAEAARHSGGAADFLLHLIPRSFVGAFAQGDVLQILVVALLFGAALGRLGEHGRPVMNLLNDVSRVFFGIVAFVTRLAPAAAAGAMAFTVGQYGLGAIAKMAQLIACVYLTSAAFIFLAVGLILRACGFSLWKLLKLLKEELLVVLGCSSSEPALPALMEKLERAGCARQTVGLVVPAGYSFNLDGTCIYLTMAALFIAQATDTPMDLGQQLSLLVILLITSKGAAGITGSGFVTLAATLAATDQLPVAGMALILGVDRFLSESRAITNFIGNAAATLVVSKWNGDFDPTRGGEVLASDDGR
ncbi:MAG: C4-dicarboxylate transporter DctA [Opitutales bacterium]